MTRDYFGWFVRYHVDLDGIIAAFPEIDGRLDDFPPLPNYNEFSSLAIIREANDEESSMLPHTPSKAVRCNLNYNTFSPAREIMETHLEGKLKLEWLHPYHYMETLAHFE